MHKSEDTDFYLKRGFKVVAVDGDPDLIRKASLKYKDHVDKNQLILLNFAVSDTDNEEIEFNIGAKTVWNSIKKSITDRGENQINTIKVRTKTLSSLIESFGVPYYCKIDIEGYDEVALNTLKDSNRLPHYISVETECIGEYEIISEEDALKTLHALYGLGYKSFKLIDQASLYVLDEKTRFYSNSKLSLGKILRRLGLLSYNRDRLNEKFNYKFVNGSSGPFGEETDKNWIDFEKAKRTLIRHRRDYYKLKKALPYGFWCDWHAKK